MDGENGWGDRYSLRGERVSEALEREGWRGERFIRSETGWEKIS